MSQMRKDIFSGEWVIFASNRKDKPYSYKHSNKIEENDKNICPFCPKNENLTPPTVYEIKNGDNWEIRVFENMYPAISPTDYESDNDNFYESIYGYGIHEIVVDTPEHTMDMSNFSNERFVKLFKVFIERIKFMRSQNNIEYIQIFKNNGPLAGASISHSHWQIMGISILAKEQERMLEAFKEHKNKTQRCIMCDIVKHEIEVKKRIISQNDFFVSLVPYASRQSFEVWIIPKRHVSTMPLLNQNELEALVSIFRDMIKRVQSLRDGISFNVCFQEEAKSFPNGLFHWYIKILPRIGTLAGFEQGTRCFINPVIPEFAAEFYRKK